MSLLPDYSRQATDYDETRGASPSVLRALEAALEGAPGPRLADIGGGTGNYALAFRQRSWTPVVVDRSPAMLGRAAGKGVEVVEADAEALPFADQSFDAAMLISMLHHVSDRPAALREARRVLRPGGRLAVLAFTDTDAASLWVLDYFPVSREWMAATHPPRDELLSEMPGATRIDFAFEDMEDASLAASSADPRRILEAARGGGTSYFERMRRDHPEQLEAGVDRLRADIDAGRAPSHPGTATVLSWGKPA